MLLLLFCSCIFIGKTAKNRSKDLNNIVGFGISDPKLRKINTSIALTKFLLISVFYKKMSHYDSINSLKSGSYCFFKHFLSRPISGYWPLTQ